MDQQGTLIIVSGPSGAGKSVLVETMIKTVPGLRFSVSHTTRPPRPNEQHGVHYFFVSPEEFKALIGQDALLEWAEVYGNYYGTSKKFIDETLARGEDVILDVDVQGARSIRDARKDAVGVFVMPPSYQVLRNRLEKRALDKDYVIEQRLKIALAEIQHYANYDFLIINHDLGASIEELKGIIFASRCKMTSRSDKARAIIATFGGVNA